MGGAEDDATLSIAILTRCRWELARRCLDSVIDQARERGVRVLVLVNGSDDDTAERIRELYPDVEVHESVTNLGCPGGRNRLMELSSAEWVAHIDDDGTVDPDFVEAVVSAIRSVPPECMVVAGRIVDPDVEPDPTFVTGPASRFSGGVCAIRRDDFLRLGGYPDGAMRQGEEGALAIRLHDAGLTIQRFREVVLNHPLVHGPEKQRLLVRTGLRQSLLTGVATCPWWLLPGWILWKLAVHLRVAVRARAPGPYIAGLRDALGDLGATWRARRPVSARAILASSSRFGPHR